MITARLETDYLVIGAGATAMAFVDTLLTEQPEATVLMVDRQHRPGGHWNHAYPFVKLHQPSESYGVASRELSQGQVDAVGNNAGLYGLASGAEVLAYFDSVMQQRFLPSGRVRWLPMSEHSLGADGSHLITSLTSGQQQPVQVRKKVVNATHARTEVPATHAPKYGVHEGVRCVPVNDLPKIARPYAKVTVVGSGKTGMDAVLWLLENGVAPEAVRWVMPRDAWFMNRANLQPGLENFERSMGATLGQMQAMAQAKSLPELFDRLEAHELLMRIDPQVQPSTYRCAVVSPAELTQLRRVKEVVRLGRVKELQATQMVLQHGTVAAEADTLYVDCSASAITHPPKLPVFDGDSIHLLFMRTCQPLFSAAVIAYVESHVADADEKNKLCTPVPSPELPLDWLRMWGVSLLNGARWRGHAGLNAWLMQCRLNGQAVYMRGVKPDDKERMGLLMGLGAASAAAAANIPVLMASAAPQARQ